MYNKTINGKLVLTDIDENGVMQPVYSNIIVDNLVLEDNYEPVILQNAETTSSIGTIINVGAYKTLVIEITGTSTSKTVSFEACGQSEIMQSIEGIKKLNLSSPTIASQTTTDTSTTPEIWEFDVGGLYQFQAKISIIGNGNCTIKGVLI